MNTTTQIGQARARVQAEQEAINAKQDAFEAFIRRIREIPTDHAAASSIGVTTVTGARRHSTSATGSGCQKVLTAFAETVHPHSIEDVDTDEPLLETVRSEFTESIAVALAPTTEASFTSELEGILVAEVESRQAATTALSRALGREIKHSIARLRSLMRSPVGSVDPRNHRCPRLNLTHSSSVTRRSTDIGLAVRTLSNADRSFSTRRRATASKQGSATGNLYRIYTTNSR